ncbi:hypothetical protein B0H13DRAFT_1900628 [Mycena leptocephala]|nr:hypothetical protein B0H13DRAFT_1900628 [Mycena leptocephala]
MAKNLTSTGRPRKSKKMENTDERAAARKAARRLALATYRDKNAEELASKARLRMARPRKEVKSDTSRMAVPACQRRNWDAEYRARGRNKDTRNFKSILRHYDAYYRQNGKQYIEPKVRDYQEALKCLEEERWLAKMPEHVRQRNKGQAGRA